MAGHHSNWFRPKGGPFAGHAFYLSKAQQQQILHHGGFASTDPASQRAYIESVGLGLKPGATSVTSLAQQLANSERPKAAAKPGPVPPNSITTAPTTVPLRFGTTGNTVAFHSKPKGRGGQRPNRAEDAMGTMIDRAGQYALIQEHSNVYHVVDLQSKHSVGKYKTLKGADNKLQSLKTVATRTVSYPSPKTGSGLKMASGSPSAPDAVKLPLVSVPIKELEVITRRMGRYTVPQNDTLRLKSFEDPGALKMPTSSATSALPLTNFETTIAGLHEDSRRLLHALYQGSAGQDIGVAVMDGAAYLTTNNGAGFERETYHPIDKPMLDALVNGGLVTRTAHKRGEHFTISESGVAAMRAFQTSSTGVKPKAKSGMGGQRMKLYRETLRAMKNDVLEYDLSMGTGRWRGKGGDTGHVPAPHEIRYMIKSSHALAFPVPGKPGVIELRTGSVGNSFLMQ
jgi:hypothetical protein